MRNRGMLGWLCACLLLIAGCQENKAAQTAGAISQNQPGQSIAAGDNQKIDWKKFLIGAWQDSAEVAAGYTNLYQFKEDGTFRFTPNEMICDQREAGYSGKWELSGQQLKLTVLKEREWVGGKLEPATGSCGSKMELVEAVLETKDVNPPRTMSFSLVPEEPSQGGYPAVKFGESSYWRILDKPLEDEETVANGEDSQTPEQIVRNILPDVRIAEVITEDLNHDQKKESVLLTEDGSLYFLDANGELSLVAEQIVTDEGAGEPATISVLPAVSKETHVSVLYSYFPSNTQIMVFAIRDGQLKTIFEAMGDQGIELGENHTIIQHWKSYRQDGGFDDATTVYQWNEEKQEYVKGATNIKKGE